MEWRIKLEARSVWGEIETIEVGHFKRRVIGLTAEEVGLSLEGQSAYSEAKRPVIPIHSGY